MSLPLSGKPAVGRLPKAGCARGIALLLTAARIHGHVIPVAPTLSPSHQHPPKAVLAGEGHRLPPLGAQSVTC